MARILLVLETGGQISLGGSPDGLRSPGRLHSVQVKVAEQPFLYVKRQGSRMAWLNREI